MKRSLGMVEGLKVLADPEAEDVFCVEIDVAGVETSVMIDLMNIVRPDAS